jgi:hypothetical protein
LERLPFFNTVPKPLHSGLRVDRADDYYNLGKRHGYEWPDQAKTVRQQVTIEFHADPKAIVAQDPMLFTAIKPVSSRKEYRRYGFVESLQQTLKKARNPQYTAIAAVEGVGAEVTIDYQRSGEPVVAVSAGWRSHDLGDAEMPFVAAFDQLEKLDLQSCPVTDAGLAHLKRLKQLKSLNLDCCRNVTDAGMEHLKELPQLQTLVLDGTRVTDAGLEPLEGLPELQGLFLYGVTDAGLEHVARMPHLRRLSIGGEVTDAGLEHLAGLTKLEELNLTTCQGIYDAGLEQLRGLAQLKKLQLPQRITVNGVEKLRQALPKCKITRYGDRPE